jgi:hypothetical protein
VKLPIDHLNYLYSNGIDLRLQLCLNASKNCLLANSYKKDTSFATFTVLP